MLYTGERRSKPQKSRIIMEVRGAVKLGKADFLQELKVLYRYLKGLGPLKPAMLQRHGVPHTVRPKKTA